MERDGFTKRRQPGDDALHRSGLNHSNKVVKAPFKRTHLLIASVELISGPKWTDWKHTPILRYWLAKLHTSAWSGIKI